MRQAIDEKPTRAGCPMPFLRRMLRIRSDRTGTAAITFAMGLPVLLLFMCGLIEFGRFMWTDHALAHAAGQATRYAIANPSASMSEIESYAASQLLSVDKNAASVTAVQESLDGIPYLTVTVAYPFQTMLPYIPLGSLSLTGISRLRI